MSKTSTIGSAKSSMKRKNSIWHALPYIAPHFIIFAVFGIIPIIFGIGLAFTRWNMVGAPKFVGLQNFAKIFDPSTYFYSIFWRDLGHTLLFVLVSVPLTIIVPLLLAVALSKKGLKGAGLFQAIFYIPGLISIAAGALVWRMVFNSQFGLLNTTFHTDINWLGKNPYAWITIFVLVLWAVSAATSSSTVPRSPAWTRASTKPRRSTEPVRSGSSSPSPCRKSSCRCSTPPS